jgi:tetratricopeptide (TPR) repeat protein
MSGIPIVRGAAAALLPVAVALLGCGGPKAATKPAETSPVVKARMAQSYLNAGRVGEALATMQEAVDAEPANAAMRLQQGQLLFQAGRFAEAEAAFRKGLEIDPYLTDAHNYLGTVYQELGRFGDAEREYRLALEDRAYPTPELVYLNLGILYADQEKQQQAIESLRAAVGINPKYYKAHFQLAALLERAGRFEEAAREYEVAEPGFRNNGDYFYRRGLTYFRLGRHDHARDMLSRVLTIAPGSESAARADELLEMME